MRTARALAALHARIRRCRQCPLWRTGKHAVPGEGSAQARIVLVGEGPGKEEDLTGRPFVGRAGRVLDELLASAGLRRHDLYITNVVKHRATNPGAPNRDRPPGSSELAACAPWLAAQIGLIRPRIVVTLGRVPLAALLPGARIRDVHGRPQQCGGLTILPLYHPAYVLHSPSARPVLFRDIQTLARLGRCLPRRPGRGAPEPGAGRP